MDSQLKQECKTSAAELNNIFYLKKRTKVYKVNESWNIRIYIDIDESDTDDLISV